MLPPPPLSSRLQFQPHLKLHLCTTPQLTALLPLNIYANMAPAVQGFAVMPYSGKGMFSSPQRRRQSLPYIAKLEQVTSILAKLKTDLEQTNLLPHRKTYVSPIQSRPVLAVLHAGRRTYLTR
jgi:hypothetical protein